MSEKIIESNGKGFLVLILPISFLIIFLVATWKVLLAVLVLVIIFQLWQQYQWQKWCGQVDPVFHEMIRENQGKITPMDLAMKGYLSGTTAKRYLDAKANEFGGYIQKTQEGGEVYYFITASTLGDIFDSSEPPEELSTQPLNTTATLGEAQWQKQSLLAPPPPQPVESAPQSEAPPPPHQKVKQSLEQQLLFGSLIQSELAKRLNVYSSTVYKRRNDPDFSEWCRNKDPDGIAWMYSEKTKEFFPVEED
ncbi:hypothetical protein [Umezakia ovalisporum]|uniref:Uncharacterized protein n=2 Tax=Umezakia ovalisporum TaxID=75695 RepID=A0AA43GXY5_9CYAN|nr:hypothetical protein [Umezakia ovalisporum]MBI1240517.1 hypothetical protein [Nostoc sp. RI_552]MDH6058287.1 hypothetical protein [Umezakia ovalisporum FSS-43]MDH6063859.1 hypothetical protein [Umezakia ovalisporum FSS-62]MDH6066583.1 hypothetical protein [Umezakia ovalisporum APH033B]MDH6071376.1 hypothetical protein [Umezakia ovalisporum CobakiLakeA]